MRNRLYINRTGGRQPASKAKPINTGSLDGKITHVTERADGLREAISRNLHEAGMVVVSVDIHADLMEQSTRSLDNESVVMGVWYEKQVERTLRQITNQYGQLDMLINSRQIVCYERSEPPCSGFPG